MTAADGAQNRLSVIIPTLSRRASLVRTIESLQYQTVAWLEIVVVDNGNDPLLAADIERFNQHARIPARLVVEPRLGLHYARHAGARHARANLLAFTDDDVTFENGWAAAYVEAFDRHPEMAAAGGPSRPRWEVPPPRWLAKMVEQTDAFLPLSLRDLGPDFILGQTESFWGLNMVIRRSDLFDAGGFNPELFGDIYLGDGEGGLFRALLERHCLVGYVPDAGVVHHIPAARTQMSYFRLRMRNEGAAQMYHTMRAKPNSTWTIGRLALAASLVAMPFAAVNTLIRSLRDPVSLRIQFAAHRLIGQATYARKVLLNRDMRSLVFRRNWLSQSET